jgi:hypothetical protein
MPSNESFNALIQDLTKDITLQVHAQVKGIIADLVQTQVKQYVTEDVVKSIVTSAINKNIDEFKPDFSVFEKRISERVESFNTTISSRAERLVIDLVAHQVNQSDVPKLIQNFVVDRMGATPGSKLFSDGLLPATAIDTKSLVLSGSNIIGGRITGFSSTGIDDQATGCQLTIMDQGTVFENTLYAPRMEIRGDIVVDGALNIRGGMSPDSPAFASIVNQTSTKVIADLGPAILDKHQDRVYEKIRTDGIEVGKLIIGGQHVFEGRTMTSAIINSQLETVGRLHDLQTQGETLLSETLYTTQRRVGINTMDPATALSIWDEEVELGIGKQQKDVGRIATRREHSLVLGSNGQDNLILTPDGSVTVKKMKIGNVMLGSSPTPPNYDAPKGVIMFNENPSLGGPMGWVSLGNAAWANFGIID